MYDAGVVVHAQDGLGRLSSTLTWNEMNAHCVYLQDWKPDLVLYDAGVDVHAQDGLGRLSLTNQGLARREALVLDSCLVSIWLCFVCTYGWRAWPGIACQWPRLGEERGPCVGLLPLRQPVLYTLCRQRHSLHEFDSTVQCMFMAKGKSICGWLRPVSSRSAKQPAWRSPPVVTIVHGKRKM
jgi:hypothetical protein